jgi:hypothetical protein
MLTANPLTKGRDVAILTNVHDPGQIAQLVEHRTEKSAVALALKSCQPRVYDMKADPLSVNLAGNDLVR